MLPRGSEKKIQGNSLRLGVQSFVNDDKLVECGENLYMEHDDDKTKIINT